MATDLFGVNRRELVGGPPAFSLAADLDIELFMFSLSSCGPLRLGSGVCGLEVCWMDTERFSLLGEIRLRCCRGPEAEGVLGLGIIGSPIRKPGR